MSRSLLVFGLIGALVVGCVSVSAPSASPASSATPTLGVTTPVPTTAAPTTSFAPTPTLTASSSASGSPSASPTASATDAPTASPTAAPTESAGASESPSALPTDGQPPFDTRDLLLQDSFDDPESGWGIGNTPGGDIAYADGALQFNLPSPGNWIWSRRNTGDTNGTIRLVGFFAPESPGQFGLLCASGEELYGAMVSSFGGFTFVRIGEEGAEELDGDPEAGLDVPLDGTTQLVVECAGTNTGSFKMQAWLRGTGPLGIYESDEGPQNFDRAAAYVEAESDAHMTRLDDIFVFGVTGPDGQRDEAGDELWSHVPSDLDDNCYQSPVPAMNADQATANLVCFVGEAGDDGAEVFEYTLFDSAADMDTAYQARVQSFGTGEGTESCRDGSGEHTYQIGEEETGRVLCVDQTRGIRFDWTDNRLNILASAVDFDGDYGATYDDWVNAGPNP